MIDLHIQHQVSDGARRFALDVRLSTQAPVTALFGASGAGKTLTLQAMAGLQQPHAGHIRVAGKTLFDAATGINLPVQQRNTGYLFQHYALFPHLSVRDNIGFGLSRWGRRLRGEAAQRVDELLHSFGLSELAHSRPATLSGGQQQRVALARALACRPSVLLLDEPFAALNPLLRDELRQELRQLSQRWNIPMVLITHDVEDVLALADVAFVLDGGRVVRELCLHTGQTQENPDASTREQVRLALVPPSTRAPRAVDEPCRQALLGAVRHV